MDTPTLLRGEGRTWPVLEALQLPALRGYGPRSVPVEDAGMQTRSVELPSLLDQLSNPRAPYSYLRHQLVSEFDPHLWSLVPRQVRRLNWLAALPSELRPNWAWLMIGTAATRSPMHVDVAASAAWNLLCSGKKRWSFHAPAQAQRWGLLPDGCHGIDGETVTFVQEPGDVVVTPSGWAHEVDNLDGAVAITANFVNAHNIAFVRRYFRCAGDDPSCVLLDDVETAFAAVRVTA